MDSQRPATSRVLLLCYTTVIGIFLAAIFGTTPFLQDEAAGQAYFYTHLPFWETLFDPRFNDGLGRFRYLEYAAEAGYWNLIATGLFPRNLYDYFALFAAFLIAFGIKDIARRKGLDAKTQCLLFSVFLLSAPVYMTVLFHYRKAKVLTGLFLLLFVWLTVKKPKHLFSLLTFVITLGAFTDPLFICYAPFVALACDRFQKPFLASRAALVGLVLAGFGVLLLNGVIGPMINEKTQLLFGIPDKPNRYFNFANLWQAHQLIPDFIWPQFHAANVANAALFLMSSTFLVWAAFKHRAWWGLAFVLLMPVSIYVMLPSLHRSFYASYYGYPLFVLFLLVWVDLFRTIKHSQARLSLNIVFVLIGIAQFQAGPKMLPKWRNSHLDLLEMKTAYDWDEKQLAQVAEGLKKRKVELNFGDIEFRMYLLSYRSVMARNTDQMSYLSRLALPALYKKEIAEGRLTIKGKGVNFVPVSTLAERELIAEAKEDVPKRSAGDGV